MATSVGLGGLDHPVETAPVGSSSFLFVTLDSCRYDTFTAARLPNISRVGRTHRTFAPGNFTFSSHAAMFMGFTPGDPSVEVAYVNPKYGKIFRVGRAASKGKAPAFLSLTGRNLVHGMKRHGYRTIGTGAASWFDPTQETSQVLVGDFDRFFYPGDTFSLERQLRFIDDQLSRYGGSPVFVFLNVGETHVPYFFRGAPWDPYPSPCVPFGVANDADASRERQRACVEFVDNRLGPLLDRFSEANIIVCADHGDAWGEDDLWEHGIHHPKVLEVPLVFRLAHRPSPTMGLPGRAAALPGLIRATLRRLRQRIGRSPGRQPHFCVDR